MLLKEAIPTSFNIAFQSDLVKIMLEEFQRQGTNSSTEPLC